LQQEQTSQALPLAQTSAARRRPRLLRWFLWLLGGAAVIICLLLWGSNLLVASDQLPPHVDAAVVLQGSITAEKVRIAGALNLLHQGIPDRILLSIPPESYWGQSMPPVARNYLERTYGGAVAAKVDFCETGPEVDSTEQEAEAICGCIQKHGWQSIIVVTSDYHTRRAGLAWRRAIRKQIPQVRVWVDGVLDPDFQRLWWRSRRSAKVWLMECLKLVWTLPRE
jgi:hypothetical protein